MNSRDLIDAISGQLGSKKTAIEAVNALLDTIQVTVAKGDKVAITALHVSGLAAGSGGSGRVASASAVIAPEGPHRTVTRCPRRSRRRPETANTSGPNSHTLPSSRNTLPEPVPGSNSRTVACMPRPYAPAPGTVCGRCANDHERMWSVKLFRPDIGVPVPVRGSAKSFLMAAE